MSNLLKSFVAAGAVAVVGLFPLPGSAEAAVVGRDAAVCEAGQPSVQVRIVGFKQASGTLGVSLYDGQTHLKRRAKLRKVEVPVRSADPVDICIAVPKPGRYSVAIHHDLNNNDKKDRNDGGGFSRNPRLSIFNLKPGFKYTSFDVGNSPTRMSVRLMYANGLSIGPARG